MELLGAASGLPNLGPDELTLLLNLGERLVAELDLESVLALVAETACQVVQAETLAVPMIALDGQTFCYRAASGVSAAELIDQTFAIHEGMCGWVLSHKRPLLFGNGADYERDAGARWQPGLPSSLLVPLVCRGTIIGGLSAMGKRGGGAFDRRDLTVLTLFANQASIAIDNARLFRNLEAEIAERQRAAQDLYRLAHHDALTGLSNRFSLEDRLAQALLAARREGHPVAVMLIDMDRFKVINDSLGHQVGDLLLQEVACRLSIGVRASDIVARLGGDEFVVVLTGLEAASDAGQVANKLLRALGSPYAIAGRTLFSTPSIGISIAPADGTEVGTLLKNADAAMYRAKDQGRNAVRFFTADMDNAASERLALERELRLGLAEGQLELHYQPQIRTTDGRLHAVEALLRWQHPERGFVSPARFVPVAEESGLIEPLGGWVLTEACRQLAAWRTQGLRLRMAINLSAHQLRSPDLVDFVRATLMQYGLRGDDIEMEITESVAMQDPERAIGQLASLRALGIHLAIDDFGTGYSSLAYLKLLPIQTLKIDRAFIRDIETDTNDAAISNATLALAHSLGLKVVAEGVERTGQQAFLRARSCDFMQGYLFGRPAPAGQWTARWTTEATAAAQESDSETP